VRREIVSSYVARVRGWGLAEHSYCVPQGMSDSIIESVDSICRDSVDTPYMIIMNGTLL